MRKLPTLTILALLALAASACDRPRPDAAGDDVAGTADAATSAGGAGDAASAGRAGASTSAGTDGVPACRDAERVASLPQFLKESSGLAASRRRPGIFWTHNDSGGEPALYALDASARLVGTVRVTGAQNLDWEDIALGPCPSGDCLYVGDIGDNDAARGEVTIYRVPEPAAEETRTPPAERFTVTYPDGPRDAEALYVLPDTSVWIVSKGRKSPVALYRLPALTAPAAPAAPGAPVPLERVQELSPSGSEIDGLVTAADASPDGRWVAIRTYAWLRLYRPGPGGRLMRAYPGDGYPLEGADESQGEAVAFGRGDTLWLTSEAAPFGGTASLGRIVCGFGSGR